MESKDCLCKCISVEEMQKIKAESPDEESSNRLAEFFKVFGDSTRVRIIYFLSQHELCVADLSALVGMQQSAVSHQLKILKMHRLVKYRKDGVTVYYTLDDNHIESIFAIAREHLREQ